MASAQGMLNLMGQEIDARALGTSLDASAVTGRSAYLVADVVDGKGGCA